jgi:hypothetical protein
MLARLGSTSTFSSTSQNVERANFTDLNVDIYRKIIIEGGEQENTTYGASPTPMFSAGISRKKADECNYLTLQ